MVGHGGSSAGSYLADPTSPIPSHCASIVLYLCLLQANSKFISLTFIKCCENESAQFIVVCFTLAWDSSAIYQPQKNVFKFLFSVSYISLSNCYTSADTALRFALLGGDVDVLQKDNECTQISIT